MSYEETEDDHSFAVEGAAFNPCPTCKGTGECDPRETIPDEEWQESIEYLVECMRTGVVARLHAQGRILPRAKFALSQLREFLVEKGY